MIRVRLCGFFACFALLISGSLYAADGSETVEQTKLLPPAPIHANWVFSGLVTNESGDTYGYFFQMQRDGDQFHSISALFDAQTKQVILLDESEALIHDTIPYNWHVGRAFMRFNPINDSWIFGLKTQDKKGFNFKVDMLTRSGTLPVVQNLRPGVQLLVNQTSHLNGHIQAGADSKEQFVTAKNAWFRQIWLAEHLDKSYPFTGVLCRFNDGSGFYSVNITESDTLRGTIAGWSDEQGLSTAISQFINVKQDSEGHWNIRIASPRLHLVLSDFIKKNSVIAGFVAEEKTPTFCILTNEVIGGKGLDKVS